MIELSVDTRWHQWHFSGMVNPRVIKNCRQKLCVVVEVSFLPMTLQWHWWHLLVFAVSPEVSELGGCHRWRKGRRGLCETQCLPASTRCARRSLTNFFKIWNALWIWSSLFSHIIRGMKRGRGVCFVCWAVSVPRVVHAERLSRIWLPYRLDRIILMSCYWILLKSLFLQIKNEKRKKTYVKSCFV